MECFDDGETFVHLSATDARNMTSNHQVIASDACSVAKVFDIPELVRHIASFNTTIKPPENFITACWVDRSDLVRLSQVCRRIFEILVPEIWKHVNGAQHLLALITSMSFRYNDETGGLLEVVSLVINSVSRPQSG